MIIESREKRKVEKPRMPRTAKKMKTTTMETELGAMGVDVDASDSVSIIFHCSGYSFPYLESKFVGRVRELIDF